MRKMIAMLTVVVIAGSHPVAASWNNQSGQLPGLVSGKSIAIIAAAGGGAVAALLLYKRHHKQPETALEIPARLSCDGGKGVLVVRNRGQSPISLSDAVFKGKGFEFQEGLKTPVLLGAGNTTEIAIRMTRSGEARLELTYVESGKQRVRHRTWNTG